MRILLDAAVMEQLATGIAKATLYLYQECLRMEPTLEVIAIHRQPLLTRLPEKMQAVRAGTILPGSLWRHMVLPRQISARLPAITHFPWNGNIPKAVLPGRKVTTLHDVLPLIIPGYFRSARDEEKYRNRVQSDIDLTDLLITDSEYSKKQIADNFRLKTEPLVLRLGPTIETNGGLFPSELDRHNNFYLYVGGYDRRKGIDKLVKVFVNLHRNKQISGKLLLAGRKHYFSAEFKWLLEEGLESGIIEELGYVADAELVGLYRRARALVYPSKYEGFGLPPLEAMALGCPVITTKYTSIPEVCGEAALYIEPDNERSFAEGLMAIEQNKELTDQLKTKGRQQALRFSWSGSAEKFLRELQNLTR